MYNVSDYIAYMSVCIEANLCNKMYFGASTLYVPDFIFLFFAPI